MVSKNTNYTFYADKLSYTVETKNGEREYYVSGYITTSDRDLVNDIVTKEAMQDMMQQLTDRTIKIDVEHEAVKNSNAVIPAGRIISANLDEKGIWVKVLLNRHTKRFPEIWNSIKAKFIDAFSITFTPVKYIHKMVEGVKTRLLQQINLINVALTGVPANPAARIGDVMMKSLQDMEDNKMSEEEAKVEESTEETTKPVVEESNEESVTKEEQPVVEEKKSINDYMVELKSELLSEIKNLKETVTALQKQFDKPVLKAVAPTEIPKAEGEQVASTVVTEQTVENSNVQQPEIKPLDMI